MDSDGTRKSLSVLFVPPHVLKHIFYFIDTLYLKTGNNGEESTKSLKQLIQSETGRSSLKFNTNTSCWMSLNSKDHLITMERIDGR